MNIRVVAVGKLKESYWEDAIAFYREQLRKKVEIQLIEVADEQVSEQMSLAEQALAKQKEGERLLASLSTDDFVVAFALEGKELTPQQWKERVNMWLNKQYVSRPLVFIIGGSLGFSNAVLQRVNEKIRISRMTFPHQLMRVVVLEQISVALGMKR